MYNVYRSCFIFFCETFLKSWKCVVSAYRIEIYRNMLNFYIFFNIFILFLNVDIWNRKKKQYESLRTFIYIELSIRLHTYPNQKTNKRQLLILANAHSYHIEHSFSGHTPKSGQTSFCLRGIVVFHISVVLSLNPSRSALWSNHDLSLCPK